MLVDCGAGTLPTLARLGLPWEKLSHLLLTHLHTDHVGELASLLFALKHGACRTQNDPLILGGPKGLEKHLEALSRAHGEFILGPGFPLMVKELSSGDTLRAPQARWKVTSWSTRHTEHSLAFRVDGAGGSVGFTGDTGPHAGLGSFFRGCHVLVAECSHSDGFGMDTHLTPRSLASLALEADPELLITVHVYPPLDPEAVPELLTREGYSGRVLPGWDGLGIDCEGGTVRVVES